jgi:hypothetical protein
MASSYRFRMSSLSLGNHPQSHPHPSDSLEGHHNGLEWPNVEKQKECQRKNAEAGIEEKWKEEGEKEEEMRIETEEKRKWTRILMKELREGILEERQQQKEISKGKGGRRKPPKILWKLFSHGSGAFMRIGHGKSGIKVEAKRKEEGQERRKMRMRMSNDDDQCDNDSKEGGIRANPIFKKMT